MMMIMMMVEEEEEEEKRLVWLFTFRPGDRKIEWSDIQWHFTRRLFIACAQAPGAPFITTAASTFSCTATFRAGTHAGFSKRSANARVAKRKKRVG